MHPTAPTTARATVAAIATGETTALAETRAAIARIEAANGTINAVVVKDYDRALARAAAIDAELARGARAPLLGLPMTVKESLDVAGLPSCWGFEQFRDHRPARDAEVVRKLKGAGAIILGKSNVPVGLADLQAMNPVYGRTLNPHDPARSPGGSSGGGAAALASGMVALEYGSDIGGSLRVPAHFCGVWAIKPSYGLVSAQGQHFPGTEGADPPLGVVGPLARDPDDLALALALTARGPLDPAGATLETARVLLLPAHPLAPVDDGVAAALERATQAATAAGARIERASDLLPDLERQHREYMTMLNIVMTRGAAMGGHPAPTLDQWFGLIDAQAVNARAWAALFEHFDYVLAPVVGMQAFPHDDRPLAERTITINDAEHPFGGQFAWAGVATFPGLPAVSLPTGPTGNGLPCGVQLLAPAGRDAAAIAAARALHERLAR